MASEREKLYDLIKDLEIAMMTTRRPDGRLVSRAMATQKRAPGADLWFVTSEETHKVDELEDEPFVNLSYYKDRTREWISISGIATLSRDKAIIQQLWAPDWKVWFPEEGDERHGTADDPRLVLIGVDIDSAVFFESDKPAPVVLFEMLKGRLTGQEPDVGKMHRVGRDGGPG
jgi:general stress protein 26